MEFYVRSRNVLFVLLCVIIVFLLIHAYVLSLLFLGRDGRATLGTSVVDDAVGVAANHCMFMPAQLFPLTELQNCFYMFKVTVITVLRVICETRHWQWKVMTNNSYHAETRRVNQYK